MTPTSPTSAPLRQTTILLGPFAAWRHPLAPRLRLFNCTVNVEHLLALKKLYFCSVVSERHAPAQSFLWFLLSMIVVTNSGPPGGGGQPAGDHLPAEPEVEREPVRIPGEGSIRRDASKIPVLIMWK
ncbi:unnamed protein product [Toxocara canis]|uniref:Uncharacterized protein n=1 Tax=Toxocara canis TaxID=6265 RepID=A0A183TV22_TOXCA|nr:unnamed protein product [Toxocara canis]